MEETVENDIELSWEMYQNTLKIIKEKGKKYDFILRAGNSLHKALYKLFEIVWKGEKIQK